MPEELGQPPSLCPANHQPERFRYDDAHQILPNRPVSHGTAPVPRGTSREFRIPTLLVIISQYSTDKTYALKIVPVRRDLHWALPAVFPSTLLYIRGLRIRIIKTNKYHKFVIRWIVEIVLPSAIDEASSSPFGNCIRRGRRRVGCSDDRGILLFAAVQTPFDVSVRHHLPGEPGERQPTVCSRTLSTSLTLMRDASHPEVCSRVAKWTSLLTVPALS